MPLPLLVPLPSFLKAETKAEARAEAEAREGYQVKRQVVSAITGMHLGIGLALTLRRNPFIALAACQGSERSLGETAADGARRPKE